MGTPSQRVAGIETDADALLVLHQLDDAGQLGEGIAQDGPLPGHQLQQGNCVAAFGQLGVDAVQGVGDALHAWYDLGSVKMGNEISFTRDFYRPEPLRMPQEIWGDIRALERESEGLVGEVLGGL